MKISRVLRWTGLIGCSLALIGLLALVWMWNRIEASLPLLDAEIALPSLSAPAQIARDDLGTVTITAAHKIDAARALGFAHAQDRFFQMDLSRRKAAGELAQLFGDAALPLDRATVVHRFRSLAQQAFSFLPAEQRAELEAYALGVNAGLAALPASPWEYTVLRSEPREWLPEDSGLVFYAMVLELQNSRGTYENTLSTLRDILGPSAVNFFNPVIGPFDSALDGSTQPLPPPPGPSVIDLRPDDEMPLPEIAWNVSEIPVIGSNAIALSGHHTAHGSAIIAGDPHLGFRVPNTWYRACLIWPDADGALQQINGVSLPGVPGIIIGSNGHVAWTFTNATVDTGDLIPVDLNQAAPELLYNHGDQSLEFEEHIDLIPLKDGGTEEVTSTWTVYGPIVGRTFRGKSLAYRWTFHDPRALNFDVLKLSEARDADQAVAIAAGAGIPNQNLFVADTSGAIAWTVAGKLPGRFGFDGQFPVSWTYGDRGWDGFLPASEHPVVKGGAEQPLWSGNQRKVSGPDLKLIGEAGFNGPPRAGQIKRGIDRLPEVVSPPDLLAIQLDHRAEWVSPWQTLLLQDLADDQAGLFIDSRDEIVRLINTWDGQASADSAAYRLLRTWHRTVVRLTLEPIFAKCLRRDPSFNYQRLRHGPAMEFLHHEEPVHLLNPAYSSWRELRLDALNQMVTAMREETPQLAGATWGQINRLSMRHPFARMLPSAVAPFLNMPDDPLAGDRRMPRVALPEHGASMRFVVAPGHESEGIMHLPAGQSGNPLSPFYRAGHDAWLHGETTPFLPGETKHVIQLIP